MSEKIQTNKAPAAIGPYSQAVVVGNLIFTSGQIPLNPETGALEGKDITEQTHRVCKNLAAVLDAAGGSLIKTVKLGLQHLYPILFVCIIENLNQIFSSAYVINNGIYNELVKIIGTNFFD